MGANGSYFFFDETENLTESAANRRSYLSEFEFSLQNVSNFIHAAQLYQSRKVGMKNTDALADCFLIVQ